MSTNASQVKCSGCGTVYTIPPSQSTIECHICAKTLSAPKSSKSGSNPLPGTTASPRRGVWSRAASADTPASSTDAEPPAPVASVLPPHLRAASGKTPQQPAPAAAAPATAQGPAAVPFARPVTPASGQPAVPMAVPTARPIAPAPVVDSMLPPGAPPAAAALPPSAGPLPPHLAGAGAKSAAILPTPALPPQATGGGAVPEAAARPRLAKRSSGGGLMMIGLAVVALLVIGGGGALLVMYKGTGIFMQESTRGTGEAGRRGETDDGAGGTVTWTDASKSAALNHIKVRIDRVEFGEVRAKDARNKVQTSDNANFLQIFLELENQGDKPVDYQSWYGNEFSSDEGQVVALLADQDGHEFPMMTFGDVARVRGHVTQEQLNKRDKVQDVVIYDLPDGVDRRSIKSLHLTLPAAAYGDRGLYRFKIQAAMIDDMPSLNAALPAFVSPESPDMTNDMKTGK